MIDRLKKFNSGALTIGISTAIVLLVIGGAAMLIMYMVLPADWQL